jgi:hypothetical protein
MKRTLRWILSNTIVSAIIIYGILYQNPLASVGCFWLWINAVVTVFGLRAVDSDTEHWKDLRKHILTTIPTPSVPIWVSATCDIALAIFVGYHGWVATSIIIVFTAKCEQELHDKIKDILTAPHSHAPAPEHTPHNS